MARDRYTINRRTFIKTSGGFVITTAFSGLLLAKPGQAAPDYLEFKTMASVWGYIASGQQGLTKASVGGIEISQGGRVIESAAVERGGLLSFKVPTSGPADWVIDLDGTGERRIRSYMEDGYLKLVNWDRKNRSVFYYWCEDDQAYALEYWQENLYLTNCGDPGGYVAGPLYMAARSRSSSTIKSSLFRAKADTTSNLKAYYSFDAFTTGDATVADDSGNNNDLIVGDSPTSVDAGHSGKAILSAGSNELHRNTPFNDANFTIAAWVKFSSAPGAAHRVLFETGDHNAGSGWFFYIDKDSSALSLGDVSLAGAVSSTSAAAVGPWVFAAVVYDGTNATFYVNDSSSTSAWARPTSPAGKIYVAIDLNGDYPLDGQMDEFRYYDRALSEEDILALYGQTGSGDDDDIGPEDNAGVPAGGVVNNSGPAGENAASATQNQCEAGDQKEVTDGCCTYYYTCIDGRWVECDTTGGSAGDESSTQVRISPSETHSGTAITGGGINVPIFITADTYRKQLQASGLKTIDFWAGLRVEYPSGRVEEGLLPIGEVVDLPHNGPTVKIIVDPVEPIPQLRTEEYWWADVLLYNEPGRYKFTYWLRTTDGHESNKRWYYLELTERRS